MSTLEKALKPAQVAELLSIPLSTFYGLAHRGRIPAFKVGGQWRTEPEQLRKFIAGEWTPPAPKRKRGRPLTDYSQVPFAR